MYVCMEQCICVYVYTCMDSNVENVHVCAQVCINIYMVLKLILMITHFFKEGLMV